MYELAKQILEQTDGKICKNCLGRKLSKTIEGKNNIERADKVCEELDINLDDVDCVICDNIFDKLNDDLYKKREETLQVGTEAEQQNNLSKNSFLIDNPNYSSSFNKTNTNNNDLLRLDGYVNQFYHFYYDKKDDYVVSKIK